MPKILPITRFGNPILRQPARQLTPAEIFSQKTQILIADMRHTSKEKEYGVGLAAVQVGQPLALSLIAIKPNKLRPERQPFDSVIINACYQGIGKKVLLWEGCMSCGNGDDILFAQVPRFAKIKAQWLDQNAVSHEEILEDFVAHVFQHETDHQQGVLFVDKVEDPSSYMMADEYRKRILGQEK